MKIITVTLDGHYLVLPDAALASFIQTFPSWDALLRNPVVRIL